LVQSRKTSAAIKAIPTPLPAFETAAKGSHSFADLGFTLTGYADEIDRTEMAIF